MNPAGHPPATLAALDQEAADMQDEMLTLAHTAHRLRMRRGELQARADLTALLVARFDPLTVATIAAFALNEVGKTGLWHALYGGEL